MRFRKVFLVALVLAGLVGLWAVSGLLQEPEEKIPLSRLPKRVVEAVQKAVPGGKLIEAEREIEKDRTIYEVVVTSKGKRYEVEVTPEGKVIEIEGGEELKEEKKEEVEEKEELEEEEVRIWNFDSDPVGKLPDGWLNRFTGRGKLGRWEVIKDPTAPSGRHVLAQLSKENYGYHFNLAVIEGTDYKDLRLTVRFKAVEGQEDRGGGVVWRYQDENNYYICRANPLESNFRVYKVVKGRRRQLHSANVRIPSGKWHSLTIEMKGSRIRCFYNGKKYLEVVDDTFQQSGKIGLWTKADAVTYFDDLEAIPLQ